MPKAGDLLIETEVVRTVTPSGPDWEWVGWFVILPLLCILCYSLEHSGVFQ